MIKLCFAAAAVTLGLAGCSSGSTTSLSSVAPTTSQQASSSSSAPAPSAASTSPPAESVSPSGEPKTLEAAVAAAQEGADRFTSGDYVGAWDLMSRKFKDGIGRNDYERLGVACAGGANGSGLTITATGVRMESENTAIIRLELLGSKQSRTMVYEDGAWGQDPSKEFAQSLGKPVAEIIAEQKADGSCQG